MNELKDLCDRVVADAPPMRAGAEVLASARRSAARRRAGMGAMAAVVVVAVGALTVPAMVDTGVPAGSGPASVTSPTPGPEEAIRAYGERMAGLLVAAVPAGYTATVVEEGPEHLRPVSESPAGQPMGRGSAGVFVTDGNGRGMLSATFWPDGGQAGPLCEERPGVRCEEVSVGGVALTVADRTDGAGRHIEVFRRVTGGHVRVAAMQALTVAPAGSPPVVEPGLAVFPFTGEQLAALAADPGMVPPA